MWRYDFGENDPGFGFIYYGKFPRGKNDHMTKRYFYSEGEVPEYGIIIHLVKSKDAMRRETGKILFFGVAIYGFY